MRIILALILLLAGAMPASAYSLSSNITVDTSYVPKHLYYLSDTGCSDAYDGTQPTFTSANHGPWCSPNPTNVTLQCGDVILAKPSTAYQYTNFQITKQPQQCPSPNDGVSGIDKTGGSYFTELLCAGASVGDCAIMNQPQYADIRVLANNWAITGWKVQPNTTSGGDAGAFIADGSPQNSPAGSLPRHHVLFANDVSSGASMGFGTSDGGQQHGVDGTAGVDEFAVVGSIAHDSANWAFPCIAAIDTAGPANYDPAVSGTHIYFKGNFVISSRQRFGCSIGSDGEGMMFDTFDAHNFRSRSVMEDNIIYVTERIGIEIFDQYTTGLTYTPPTMRIMNNTILNASTGTSAGDAWTLGGINPSICTNRDCDPGHPLSPTIWRANLTLQNNISQQLTVSNVGGTYLYGLQLGNITNIGPMVIGGSGTENFFSSAITGSCVPRCNFTSTAFGYNGDYDASARPGKMPGTNFDKSPNFKNTTDLLANHLTLPTLSGFETTTAAMGWNYDTQTARSLSVIDDLTPTASGSAGKGFRAPRSSCTSMSAEETANFPSYLKGMIVHHAAGGYALNSRILQKTTLINVPCRM